MKPRCLILAIPRRDFGIATALSSAGPQPHIEFIGPTSATEAPATVRSAGGKLNLGGSNKLCPLRNESQARLHSEPGSVSGKKGIRSGSAIPTHLGSLRAG